MLDYLPGPAPVAADYLVLGAWVAGLVAPAYLAWRYRDADPASEEAPPPLPPGRP